MGFSARQIIATAVPAALLVGIAGAYSGLTGGSSMRCGVDQIKIGVPRFMGSRSLGDILVKDAPYLTAKEAMELNGVNQNATFKSIGGELCFTVGIKYAKAAKQEDTTAAKSLANSPAASTVAVGK